MRRALSGTVKITSRHGTKTGMGLFGKHLGYDYSGNNMPVVAPEDLTITGLFHGGSGGNYIEATGTTGTHRFLHLKRHSLLSRFRVRVGQKIKEGAEFARSGNTGITTGAHLHHDVRKKGTAWNASFSNYIDWEKKLTAAAKPSMPKVGSKIRLSPRDTRTTFVPGTTRRAGVINVKDNTYVYQVRGYDKKYPGRIIVNSKSAGGNGVALALYYVNGKKISGWKAV